MVVFQGGFTGNKAIRYDHQAGVALETPNGPYHVNEWVAPEIMTSNPKYAANLQYLENERQRIQKGYFNGGYNSDNKLSSKTSDTFDTSSLEDDNILGNIYNTLNILNTVLAKGIKANLILGHSEIDKLKNIEK